MSKTISNTSRSTIVLFLALCVCVFAHAADGAPAAVFTKLAISPASVEIGSPVTLTATVSNSGTLTRGQRCISGNSSHDPTGCEERLSVPATQREAPEPGCQKGDKP